MDVEVSVICLNNNKECIKSLLNQTLHQIEILLKERTDIIDERIKYDVNPEGKYILITDGKCVFEFNMLSTMVEILEDFKASIGICGIKNGDIKRASGFMLADTDDKKFSLMKYLIEKDLFFTLNNTIIKNIITDKNVESFSEAFKKLYRESNVYNFSNAFVVQESNEKKEYVPQNIIELLQYFLEKGAV